MNSLRFRLFTAFMAVILSVIAIIGLALLAFINNSPLIERQEFTRLNEAARSVGPNPPPGSNRELDAYVKGLADLYELRVLVTNNAGNVLADSNPEQPAIQPNYRLSLGSGVVAESRTGRMRDNEQGVWLYVARPFPPNRWVVFTQPQPRFQVIRFFLENLFWPLVQAGAVGTVVALLLAILVSRSIAQPLQQMSAAAQGIARGDYALQAPTAGPPEVAALGEAINHMTQQVQASQQAQRDFLANVSHELKTPLTSIQGFAQAISDGTAEAPETRQRAAQIIFSEADRMRRLVEDLLELARLDAQLHMLKLAPVEARTLLTSALDKFAPNARAKNIRLESQLPAALPALMADPDRLAQVLANLLDNAIKHTPSGGAILLSASASQSALDLTITDSGPGIPPADLPRIFERFYQVDKARARSGSVGLGLAITKDIVEAHGGSIRAENVVSGGARFSVRLPLNHPKTARPSK